MPVENRPRKAFFRRALGLNEGASQSLRGVPRPKREAHHWAETCGRRRTDEIEAGNRRFEAPVQNWRPSILSNTCSQRWAQKSHAAQVDTKSGRRDDVVNKKNVAPAIRPAQSQSHTRVGDRHRGEFALEQQRDAANDFIFHHVCGRRA